MLVLAIILLVAAVVLLVLIMANVQVTQKAINILFLIMVILIACNMAGWFRNAF